MLPLNFYNFFAGAGLASTGLTPEWECIWANDIDPKKAAAYGYDIDNIVSDMFGVTIEYDLVVPTLSALGGNPAHLSPVPTSTTLRTRPFRITSRR